jgi:hypothetical protein
LYGIYDPCANRFYGHRACNAITFKLIFSLHIPLPLSSADSQMRLVPVSNFTTEFQALFPSLILPHCQHHPYPRPHRHPCSQRIRPGRLQLATCPSTRTSSHITRRLSPWRHHRLRKPRRLCLLAFKSVVQRTLWIRAGAATALSIHPTQRPTWILSHLLAPRVDAVLTEHATTHSNHSLFLLPWPDHRTNHEGETVADVPTTQTSTGAFERFMTL